MSFSVASGSYTAKTAYPFVQPTAMSDVVGDASVEFVNRAGLLPLHLDGSFSGVTGECFGELKSADAQTLITLNGTSRTVNRESTTGRRLVEFESPDVKLRLLLDASRSIGSQAPEQLDPRTYRPTPAGVTSLSLLNNLGQLVSNDVTPRPEQQSIRFSAGSNIRFTRSDNTVTFSAIPGDGTGVFDDCPDISPFVSSIARVSGTSGNLLISGDVCYRVEPILEGGGTGSTFVPGKLRFWQDCEPCCDCSDYYNVALAIERQQRLTKYIQGTVDDMLPGYQELVEVYLGQIETANQALKLSVGRGGNCVVGISATLYNVTDEDLLAQTILLKFETENLDGGFSDSTFVSFTPNATIYAECQDIGDTLIKDMGRAVLQVNLGDVPAGQQRTATFSVTINAITSVQVTLEAKNQDLGVFVPVTKSTNIACV